MFHPCARVPILKLCLSSLHSLITVAYSCLRECRSTLILPLPIVCVRNNPTLVATLRIGWFIKPFTYQTIFQWRKPLGCLVDVCSWYPSNIWCRCRDFGVDPRASVPYVKLCLSLLHSLITVAYSRLDELRSNLILFLTVVCVRSNPMLIAASRIGRFIKPLTHLTIC